ncbi:MAG: sulfotransferase [Chromatiales bacterium]|nr:sulfotransferase [Chromatiales bacterium]
MVLSIGSLAAGSSIIGFLLTAHPNIVMTDEGELETFLNINNKYIELSKWQYKLFNYLLKIDRYGYLSWKISSNKNIDALRNLSDINNRYIELPDWQYRLFDYLLKTDRYRYLLWKISTYKNKMEHIRRSGTREKRYVYVPGQYQGRFQKLHVIGNKNNHTDIKLLANTSLLKHLRSKLEDNKISLKFIFITRNLYDNIASAAQQWHGGSLDKAIKIFAELCERNQKILEQIDSNDVFICRNEDLIANPKLQITRLCDFLKVSASADYINTCASCVVNKPTNSRLKIDWSDQHKQKINSLIKKYDFLSSYDC